MSLSKSLPGFIAALLFLILVPSQAQACYCAKKPDGGYICETHCTDTEIDNLLGAGHRPVQLVSNYLTGNFLPSDTYVPEEPNFEETKAETASCYANVTGDYVCPQTDASSPVATDDVRAKSGSNKENAKSAGTAPPSDFAAPSPYEFPFNFGNSETAFEWPPGFSCDSDSDAEGPPPVGQNSTDWKMTFNEEFNAFDPAVWNDAVWYESSNPAKNYTVEDGALKIWPQRDASGDFFNRTIDTDGKFNQIYGYFEMEAILPAGKGVWPAFWLFNHIGDRRPEIDIMEAYPGGGAGSGWGDKELHPTAFAATVWPGDGSNAGHKMLQTPDLSAAFHTYAVKWEPDKQTFYFDGKPFWVLDVTMPDPMYIMLDLWFGSASGQPNNTTPLGKENSFVVNYIRAWEKCGGDKNSPEDNPTPELAPELSVASCVPSKPRVAVEAEESFDGALTDLGNTLVKANHVEFAEGMGVNGSDAIKVNYVGNNEGSARVTARYPLSPALEYTLNFDVNFCSGFDFVKGGKLHGLGPKNPITGGNSVPDDGWSARGMFRAGGHLESYVYSQNMKGKYGEGVLSDFAFQPGRYYAVSYQVGLNNPASASNGYMRVFVDGKELINHENIKFRDTDDPESLISTLMFNTFHGGHTSEWAPKNPDGSYKTDCAYYDNFAAYPSPQVRQAAETQACTAAITTGTTLASSKTPGPSKIH